MRLYSLPGTALRAAVDDREHLEVLGGAHRLLIALKFQSQVPTRTVEQRVIGVYIELSALIGLEAEDRVVHDGRVHLVDGVALGADDPLGVRDGASDDAGVCLCDVLHV